MCKRRWLALGLLVLAVTAWAQTTVHKRTRPDGTVEFADAPFQGSESVEVPELPSYTPRPLPPQAAPTPPAQPQPAPAAYRKLAIVTPGPEQTVFFDAEGLAVTVALEPALRAGHVVTLYLDGLPAAVGSSLSLTLPDVPRGSHTLAAAVHDPGGRELIRSSPHTFYLRQRSLIRP